MNEIQVGQQVWMRVKLFSRVGHHWVPGVVIRMGAYIIDVKLTYSARELYAWPEDVLSEDEYTMRNMVQ